MGLQDEERLLAVCEDCGRPQTVAIRDGAIQSWASGGACPCGCEAFTVLTDTTT